jgi:phosphohistidine phosphatase
VTSEAPTPEEKAAEAAAQAFEGLLRISDAASREPKARDWEPEIHARAAGGPVDRERPLTAEGVQQAAALGAWLQHAGLMPDRVLVSAARRAVQTWEQAGTALPSGVQPIGDPRIGDNTVDALLAAIRETPEDALSVAVVGHNPSISELAGVLDGGRSDPLARRGVVSGFPAGGVAVFDLAVSFAAVGPGAATLRDFRVPSD